MEPSTLFHYCSTEAAYSIIRTGSLRLCDIRKSNDSAELMLFYPDLFVTLQHAYEQAPFPFTYAGLTDRNAVMTLLDACESMIAEELEDGSLTNYVFSLSEHGDMLSQWRGYANDSKGISLGFSFQALQGFADANDLFSFAKVQYIFRTEVCQLIEQYAAQILKSLCGMRAKLTEELSITEDDPDMDAMILIHAHELIARTITESLRYKLNGFEEEREWRLYMNNSVFKMPHGSLSRLKRFLYKDKVLVTYAKMLTLHEHLDFFPSEDDIVSYYAIPFKELGEGALRTIRLGANNYARIQDVRLMLQKYGSKSVDAIERSKITSYRRKQQ